MSAINHTLDTHYSVGVVLVDETDVILQVRDNKDGIMWPGKIHYWGGAMEVEDGGDPVQAALRELKEELSIEPTDITLTPLKKLQTEYHGIKGESGYMLVHMFLATLNNRRALHAYEGSGICRVDKALDPEIIAQLDLTPYAHEMLMVLRDVL